MNTEQHLCIFGDSTAWGAWDTEKGGWANRLWLYCAEHSWDVFVYNLSIDGGTTKTILDRFENESKARSADMLIFQTGGNDASYQLGLSPADRKISLEDFEKNIKSIVEKGRAFTDKILFVDLRNCDESKTVPALGCDWCYTNENLSLYNKKMNQVCDEMGVLHVALDPLDMSDFEDGLHPNTVGHQKIFEQVLKALVKEGWVQEK
jgi:lysophospholipase L1-like esterase